MASRGGRGRVISTKGAFIRQSPAKPKRKTKKRAEWDDSVNDLSVHRASAAELARRQMVALSNNLEQVRQERLQKRIRKAAHTPPTRKRCALKKEVLYNAKDLEEVLAKSDRAMNIVKDMFGDNPQKYRGVPNVTCAPFADRESLLAALNRSLPDDSTLGPSKLDVLSDSVMAKTALNDMQSDEEYSEEDDIELDYHPEIDLDRFKKLLAMAEEESEKAKREDERRVNPNTNRTQRPGSATNRQEEAVKKTSYSSHQRPDLRTPADSPVASPRVTAINDTGKCQRTMARTNQGRYEEDDREVVEEEKVEITNLDDLKKVLDGLENNIAEYERMSGRQQSAQRLHSNTFSGYTVGLIDAVTRMTVYLKESEMRHQAETTMREQLCAEVHQLRTMVDGLTSDLIATQDEYTMLQIDVTKFRRETTKEVAGLKQIMEAYSLINPPIAVPARHPPPPATTSQSSILLPPHSSQSLVKPVPTHQPQPAIQQQQQFQPQPISQQQQFQPQPITQQQQFQPQPTTSTSSTQLANQQQQYARFSGQQGQGHPGQIPGQPFRNGYDSGQNDSGVMRQSNNPNNQSYNPNVSSQSHSQSGHSYVNHHPQAPRQPVYSQARGGHSDELGHGDARARVTAPQYQHYEPAQSHAAPGGDFRSMPAGLQQNQQQSAYQHRQDTQSEAPRQQQQQQEQEYQRSNAYLISPPPTSQANGPGAGPPGPYQKPPPYPQQQQAATGSAFISYSNQEQQGPKPSNKSQMQQQQNNGGGEHQPGEADEEGKSVLEQIAELNKAHQEAHRKLAHLTQSSNAQNQKKQQPQQPDHQHGVSPSISPISFADSTVQSSQSYPRQQSNMNGSGPAKQIRVNLPRMDP